MYIKDAGSCFSMFRGDGKRKHNYSTKYPIKKQKMKIFMNNVSRGDMIPENAKHLPDNDEKSTSCMKVENIESIENVLVSGVVFEGLKFVAAPNELPNTDANYVSTIQRDCFENFLEVGDRKDKTFTCDKSDLSIFFSHEEENLFDETILGEEECENHETNLVEEGGVGGEMNMKEERNIGNEGNVGDEIEENMDLEYMPINQSKNDRSGPRWKTLDNNLCEAMGRQQMSQDYIQDKDKRINSVNKRIKGMIKKMAEACIQYDMNIIFVAETEKKIISFSSQEKKIIIEIMEKMTGE